MNFRLVILLICACVFGTAWSDTASNCDAQVQTYRQCTDKIRIDHLQEIASKIQDAKPQIEKCFSSNGCTVPPDEPDKPNNSTKHQCRDDINLALKDQVHVCVRKTYPNFEYPVEEQRPPSDTRIWKTKEAKKGLDKACKGSADKIKAVQDCFKKTLATNTSTSNDTPSEAEQKQRFQDNCQKKQKCRTALGDCHTQYDALKQTVCQCNQDARTKDNLDSTRASTPSCAGLTKNAKKGKHPETGTKRPCSTADEKDWCTDGYDAWKSSHKKPQGQQKSGQ